MKRFTLVFASSVGLVGLACLAAVPVACVASTNFIVLYVLMRQELGRFEFGALLSLTLRVALASAVMAAACLASTQWLLPDWAAKGLWLRLLWLLATIGVAAALFAISATALKVSELTAITAAFRRRLQRATAR